MLSACLYVHMHWYGEHSFLLEMSSENYWKVFVETTLQVLYRAPKLPGCPQREYKVGEAFTWVTAQSVDQIQYLSFPLIKPLHFLSLFLFLFCLKDVLYLLGSLSCGWSWSIPLCQALSLDCSKIHPVQFAHWGCAKAGAGGALHVEELHGLERVFVWSPCWAPPVQEDQNLLLHTEGVCWPPVSHLLPLHAPLQKPAWKKEKTSCGSF